jgi:exosome complex component RRP41
MPPPLKSDEVKEEEEINDDDDDNSSVFLSLNPITNSSGSAFIQLGDGRTTTKIFVSVFGPKKTTSRAQDERVSKLRGTLDVSVTLASFAFKSHESSSRNIKDIEMDLTEKLTKCLRGVVVLESFPKAVVEVRCAIADANGDELRGLVLATSSALMHARVEVRDILCACTAVIEEDGEVRLVEDYTNTNDAKSKSSKNSGGRKTSSARKAVGAVTVAYMPRVKKVTNILSVGRWGNANNLKKAEELAMQGCEEVAEVIKAAF